jgi:hypothetical protein
MKFISVLSILVLVLFFSTAHAIELRFSGNVVYISGRIDPGDEFKFRDAIVNRTVKYVDLNSPGGNIEAAGQIGRQIRRLGLTTIVDASRSVCGSACTGIFASGTGRLYINAKKVKDGVGSPKNGRGLGFHEGNNWLRDGRKGQSGAATANMIAWYYEFGTPKMADFAKKADWKHYFYVSPETALANGFATSVQKP